MSNQTAPDSSRALILFGDYWDDMWRRRQQLAWRLAQGNWFSHVVYVERPLPVTSLLKFLVGRADRDGSDRWRRMLGNHSWFMPVSERLSVLTTFAPLSLTGPECLFHLSELCRDRWLLRYLARLSGRMNLDRPLVCVSHPQLSVEVVQRLNASILWYDCTEDFAALPGTASSVRAQITATDRYLTQQADVVTAVSRTLFEEKHRINPHTYRLPNGVDIELFSQPKEMRIVPPELANGRHPVLAFVGGMSEEVDDWKLLDAVATLRPAWTFLLIGPLEVSARTWHMLQSHHNILCLGQKAYRDLPPYLVHSDVCFQFYRPSRGNDTRNSQKLFLYLAAGKPVVTTRSADALAYADYVSLVDRPPDFVAAVEEALRTDSPAKVQCRQEVSRANSWDVRVNQIGEILDSVSWD